MNDIAIELSEHEVFAFDKGSNYYQALIDRLNKDDYNPSNPSSCLGLEWGNRSRTEIKAGYFIGVKWIEEGKSAI